MKAQTEALIRQQLALSKCVVKEDAFRQPVKLIAGVDVAYQKNGDYVVAAITVLSAETLDVVESATFCEQVAFPYIPGLFSFRELPPILKAYERLSCHPDLIIVDGQGYAHPRRFG
ncbi:hypothetical protein DMA11_24450 [Marinilabiliaceae bacterium JC017]|nr:hypothetical protein DMA11_24450 [Marinilabiliaceae bacterium JC017]